MVVKDPASLGKVAFKKTSRIITPSNKCQSLVMSMNVNKLSRCLSSCDYNHDYCNFTV